MSPPFRTAVIRFEKKFGKRCAGRGGARHLACCLVGVKAAGRMPAYRRQGCVRSGLVRLRSDDRLDLGANLFDESGFASFDVQAQERLSVGSSNIEAPIIRVE